MKLYQAEVLKANKGQLLVDTRTQYTYYSNFEHLEELVKEFANLDLNLQGLELPEVEEVLMDNGIYYGWAQESDGYGFNYLTYNTSEDITNALAVIRSADFNIIG